MSVDAERAIYLAEKDAMKAIMSDLVRKGEAEADQIPELKALLAAMR